MGTIVQEGIPARRSRRGKEVLHAKNRLHIKKSTSELLKGGQITV